MVKSFLIIIFSQIFLFANQLLVVIADTKEQTKAKAICIEDNKIIYKDIDINLGKNGLAHDGTQNILKNLTNEFKQEGDKRAPIGIYNLNSAFGYSTHIKTGLNYKKTKHNLICVDDSTSEFYNKIIPIPKIPLKSFEFMKRDDKQYKLGIVLAHNKNGIKNSGSCLFIHIQKQKDSPTAGCTSMSEKDLKKVLAWLDNKKEPTLVQISRDYLPQVYSLYPELKGLLN